MTINDFNSRYETRDENNFEQPRIYYRKLLNKDERARLVQNIVSDLQKAEDNVQVLNFILTHLIMEQMLKKLSRIHFCVNIRFNL